MKIYEKIIKEGDLCFDIGANCGNKSSEMLLYKTKIVCVEPQIGPFNELSRKFYNNKNVVLINKALSSKNGAAQIFISAANTLSSMSDEFIQTTSKLRFKGIGWGQPQTVSTTTLDDLIEKYGTPKFCKIDVEGYESEVLKGLSSSIPCISIEFVPELKHKTFECMDIVKNISNCKFNYSEGESMIFSFDDWVGEKDMIDFLTKNNDFERSFGDLYIKMF